MDEICMYCGVSFDPVWELGRWSCRYHPRIAEPSGHFPCCGVDGTAMGFSQQRRGCRRSDHTTTAWSDEEEEVICLAFRDEAQGLPGRGPTRTVAPADVSAALWRTSLVESPTEFFSAAHGKAVAAFFARQDVLDALRAPLVELRNADEGRWQLGARSPVSLAVGNTTPETVTRALVWIAEQAGRPQQSETYLARRFYDRWAQGMDDVADLAVAASLVIPHYVVQRHESAPGAGALFVARYDASREHDRELARRIIVRRF